MGNVEIVLEQNDEEKERPVIRFDFYAPLEEGGRAMVQVTGRDTVMGVDVAKVNGILGDLGDLRSEKDDTATADSE
jgi:hypothetical protein